MTERIIAFPVTSTEAFRKAYEETLALVGEARWVEKPPRKAPVRSLTKRRRAQIREEGNVPNDE